MKKAPFLIFLLMLNLTGCATKVQQSATTLGALAGGYATGFLVGCHGNSISGANIANAFAERCDVVVQNNIALSPTVLNNLISNTLDVKPNADSEKPSANLRVFTLSEMPTSIAESNEGQITTNWKPIPGKKAGLYKWEKTYECEVRHIITIKRSYQASNKSDLYISTEVRERPNLNYPWTTANTELGNDSLKQLTSQLSETIRTRLNNKGTKK